MNQKLLHKLQQKIRDLSCNTLLRVYPSQIKEWTEAINGEIGQFIQELLTERLMDAKYDFQCTCGNNCTAYHRNLEKKCYKCIECEKEYDFEEILDKSTLLYELDKQAILDFNEESVDFKDISRKMKKVVKIPVEQEASIKMDKKKIFIGSSSTKEIINKMEMIARIIDDLGGEALPWNAKGKGLFVPGNYTLDSLINTAHKIDGAIFMFNAEDETWYSDKCELKKNVRDNVLLEYGLFVGILGKNRVTFICEGQPKIATDLLGITYINGEQSEYQIKPDLEGWLDQL